MSGMTGRHVVITGGNGGLGRAVVQAFVDAGAICHLPVRGPVPESAPARVAPRAGGSADGASASAVRFVGGVDLTNEAAVSSFYGALPRGLWASVHLAGGFAAAPITDTALADLRGQLDINLVTAFLCCREAVRCFRAGASDAAASGAPGGRIVNVASRAALEPAAHKAAYGLSKAAVVSLTQSLADELRGEAILVNAVAPGTIDTDANRAAMPGADPTRMTSPAEIAAVILWLCSGDNGVASGAVVPVYGRS